VPVCSLLGTAVRLEVPESQEEPEPSPEPSPEPLPLEPGPHPSPLESLRFLFQGTEVLERASATVTRRPPLLPPLFCDDERFPQLLPSPAVPVPLVPAAVLSSPVCCSFSEAEALGVDDPPSDGREGEGAAPLRERPARHALIWSKQQSAMVKILHLREQFCPCLRSDMLSSQTTITTTTTTTTKTTTTAAAATTIPYL